MLAPNIIFYLCLSAIFLAIISLVIGTIVLLKFSTLNRKLTILFSGKDAASLEEVILKQSEGLKTLDKEIQELFEISNKIHALSFKGIHKVGIIRFNPFKDIGGDQSFALALLDGKSSGVVISSLHTREGTRMYAKPISKGASEKYALTDEEISAIKEAVSQKPANMQLLK